MAGGQWSDLVSPGPEPHGITGLLPGHGAGGGDHVPCNTHVIIVITTLRLTLTCVSVITARSRWADSGQLSLAPLWARARRAARLTRPDCSGQAGPGRALPLGNELSMSPCGWPGTRHQAPGLPHLYLLLPPPALDTITGHSPAQTRVPICPYLGHFHTASHHQSQWKVEADRSWHGEPCPHTRTCPHPEHSRLTSLNFEKSLQ